MQYQILLAAAFAALTHAQTIVTSSAASVVASTTESQVMPPAATASFSPAGIDPTTACKREELPILANLVDTDSEHSQLVPRSAEYLPSDLRWSCLCEYMLLGKHIAFCFV